MSRLIDTLPGAGTPEAKKLDELASSGPGGFRVAAMLTKAAVAAEKGDAKSAAAIYGQINADTGLEKPWRDLALIRKTEVEYDQLKPEEVIARMKPLAIAGDPWFGSAGEMLAIAYMKSGQQKLAGPVFAAIAKDKTAPRSVRSRAGQMAGLLGIDAVEIDEDKGEGANGNAGSDAQ